MHKIRIVIKGKIISDVEIIELPDSQEEQKVQKYAVGLERLKKAVMGNEVASCAQSR